MIALIRMAVPLPLIASVPQEHVAGTQSASSVMPVCIGVGPKAYRDERVSIKRH